MGYRGIQHGPSDNRLLLKLPLRSLSSLVYLLKMVIFHRFLYVYQRHLPWGKHGSVGPQKPSPDLLVLHPLRRRSRRHLPAYEGNASCTPKTPWFLHGSLVMSPLNITQPLDSIRYMVYNGYYKVMSNIPKMGQLPTPVLDAPFRKPIWGTATLGGYKANNHGGIKNKTIVAR